MRKNIEDATYRFALTGAYGRFLERQIMSEVKNFVFLDIGANQGLFSLIAARNPVCRRAFAFEPNPHVFSLLVDNIQLNSARVDPFCAGITSAAGSPFTLKWSPRHTGRGTIASRTDEEDASGWAEACIVGVNRAFIDALPIAETDELVVKIDVEGQEEVVLKELFASARGRQVRAVLVEVRANVGGADHQGRIRSILSAEGFAFTAKHGSETDMDAIFRRTLGAGGGSLETSRTVSQTTEF